MIIAIVYLECFEGCNPFEFVHATCSISAWTKNFQQVSNNLLLKVVTENPSHFADGHLFDRHASKGQLKKSRG